MSHAHSSKIRAWLELMRISNLPTVWTNVLTGCAIAGGLHHRVEPLPTIGLCIAMSLLYIAGMAMNDVLDRAVDAQERPHRPIPSGRIGAAAAQNFIAACLVLGLALAWWVKPASLFPAGALVLCIGLYNLLHKQFAWSVLLMGACRALLILAAAADADWDRAHRLLIFLPLALGLYTIGITLISRGETKDTIDSRKYLSLLMPVIVFIAPLLSLQPTGVKPMMGVTALVMLGWMIVPILALLRKPPRPVRAILAWLAGMCLVDAYYLAMLGQNILAGIAIGCFALTAWGHRRILGT